MSGESRPAERLQASARVAFAALMHDLGKFAERARILDDDPAGKARLDAYRQIYCPQPAGAGAGGYFSHEHAAYTAAAFDLIEKYLPPLTHDVFPFAARQRARQRQRGDQEPDDSLVNAAAGHHLPHTFLQWMVACGDRIASGFERREWEEYNAAREPTGNTSHYRTRLISLFGELKLGENASAKSGQMRHLLRRAGPETLAPVPVAAAEPRSDKEAQEEYRRLWDGFVEALAAIPAPHRADWALWLDHFDTVWFQFTHAIPSATAGRTKPEVSLYDHSRTTAALATALWRYHYDRFKDGECNKDDECNKNDENIVAAKQKDREDWDCCKFLLVQGDLFGIQRFIFADGGESNRGAAKILRGRSAYVSLLSECAALKILEALHLPPSSQVINAAGKFLIVAPNTEEAREAVAKVQRELDEWFLAHSFGEAGIGIAMCEASPNDFVKADRFKAIQQALVNDLDEVKHRRLDLCGADAPEPVFMDAQYPNGPCRYHGRWPAQVRMDEKDEGPTVHRLTFDQRTLGRVLAQKKALRLRVWREGDWKDQRASGRDVLKVPVFGYRLAFAPLESEEKERRDDRAPLPARVWDLSLPERGDAAPWHGLAWRPINAYVPVHTEEARARYEPLYEAVGIEPDETGDRDGGVRSFQELAAEALDVCEGEQDGDNGIHLRGVPALMAVKGDIDDLGKLFGEALKDPSFAKWAALSRQVNAFFTLKVPWLLACKFPQVYTVFAGGDDFFFIGPWRQMLDFVSALREAFAAHVAGNPGIHFSLAMVMVKPQVPVSTMARMAKSALEDKAKKYALSGKGPVTKNAVTCFQETVPWSAHGKRPGFTELQERYAALRGLAREFPEISTSGLLYDVLRFIDMRAAEDSKPENTLWRALLRYRTRRQIVDRLPHDVREEHGDKIHERIVTEIGAEGIDRAGAAYRIPLYRFLYERRSYRKGDRR